jgi:hypothetical protein
MPEAYLKHKVFDDLKYMKEFYDSISMSCFSFVATGTHGITNYASYVYSAIEGTLDSITILLNNYYCPLNTTILSQPSKKE